MEIRIKETNKIEEIKINDSKSGCDWSCDMLGNHCNDHDGYDDDNNMILSQSDFDWWTNYCAEYELAEADYTDAMRRLGDDGEKQDNLNYWQNAIGDYDFNDLPSGMRFITGQIEELLA